MLKVGRIISVLFLSALLPGQAFVQTSKPAKILLAERGSFHGYDVKARNGEKWLGLYVTKRGSALIESTVTVRRVFDEIVDDDLRKPTGKYITVGRREPPVFLVKNAEMLKPGPAITVYRGDFTGKHELNSGIQVKLKLKEQNYQLKVVSKYPRSKECPDCLPMDSRLLLQKGNSSQMIYDLGKYMKDEWGEAFDVPEMVSDVSTWYLLWAGDVDGDGKLDLYLSLSWHYNVQERKLFLSSQARPGQLVREVASLTLTGC